MAADDFDAINDMNENIINDDQNIINDEIIINNENDRFQNIILLLGLNPNVNYPLKVIQQGIIEMCMTKQNLNGSKYSKIYKFRDDSISKKMCVIIYGSTIYYQVSVVNIGSAIRRMYRHYKYSKIVTNIDYNKIKTVVPETLGFNYDNPRWKPLDSLFIC
jgi:hypothetical protein